MLYHRSVAACFQASWISLLLGRVAWPRAIPEATFRHNPRPRALRRAGVVGFVVCNSM